VLFVLAIAVCYVTYAAQHDAGAMVLGERHSLAFRLANAAVSCANYLAKGLVPLRLYPQYVYLEGGHPAWIVAGAVVLLAGLTAFALRFRRTSPWLAVGWLWFLGTLVPVLGVVQVGEQGMADRFTYVPFIGLAAAVAFGASALAERSVASRRAALVLAPLLLLAWSILTCIQVGYWKDDKTLFGYIVEVEPRHHIAHGSLGNIAFDEHRFDDAIVEYKKALELNPGYAQWLNNLGLALDRSGRADEARVQYEAALACDPRNVEAHHNLGLQFATKGQYGPAIEHFEAALRTDPDLFMVHYNLGLAQLYQGRKDVAIAEFERSLDLNPGFPLARTRLDALRSEAPPR
jgi:tetratricopeptide (TPR) repeat protein